MNEKIISRKDLILLFTNEEIVDTNVGWVYNGFVVDIIAIHEIDTKYLQDITRAKTYKIVPKMRIIKNEN